MRGKLSPKLLRKHIFTRLGIRDTAVIVGPAIGEDAAIIDLGDNALVMHVDPITEANELMGWLAVHVACNDVAVRGARPRWLLQVLYLPEGCKEELVASLAQQVDEAARELGASIVGGHSEYTPGLSRPLISMTAVGLTSKRRLVTTKGAKPGDAILITKGAGIEGTAIIATDFKEELENAGVPPDLIERGRRLLRRVSVVKEALSLAEGGVVSSMHDPTEGGVLGGLTEMAYASGTTMVIKREGLPVLEETRAFCEALKLDPLKLISSGSLLATVPRDKLRKALRILEDVGVVAKVIGEVKVRSGPLVEVRDVKGRERYYEVDVQDEIAKLWAGGRRGGPEGGSSQ